MCMNTYDFGGCWSARWTMYSQSHVPFVQQSNPTSFQPSTKRATGKSRTPMQHIDKAFVILVAGRSSCTYLGGVYAICAKKKLLYRLYRLFDSHKPPKDDSRSGCVTNPKWGGVTNPRVYIVRLSRIPWAGTSLPHRPNSFSENGATCVSPTAKLLHIIRIWSPTSRTRGATPTTRTRRRAAPTLWPWRAAPTARAGRRALRTSPIHGHVRHRIVFRRQAWAKNRSMRLRRLIWKPPKKSNGCKWLNGYSMDRMYGSMIIYVWSHPWPSDNFPNPRLVLEHPRDLVGPSDWCHARSSHLATWGCSGWHLPCRREGRFHPEWLRRGVERGPRGSRAEHEKRPKQPAEGPGIPVAHHGFEGLCLEVLRSFSFDPLSNWIWKVMVSPTAASLLRGLLHCRRPQKKTRQPSPNEHRVLPEGSIDRWYTAQQDYYNYPVWGVLAGLPTLLRDLQPGHPDRMVQVGVFLLFGGRGNTQCACVCAQHRLRMACPRVAKVKHSRPSNEGGVSWKPWRSLFESRDSNVVLQAYLGRWANLSPPLGLPADRSSKSFFKVPTWGSMRSRRWADLDVGSPNVISKIQKAWTRRRTESYWKRSFRFDDGQLDSGQLPRPTKDVSRNNIATWYWTRPWALIWRGLGSLGIEAVWSVWVVQDAFTSK